MAGRGGRDGLAIGSDEAWRLAAVGGVLGLVLCAVLVRLVILQGLAPSDASREVGGLAYKKLDHPGPRDRIVDRDGEVLAYDRRVVRVRAEVRVPMLEERAGKVFDRLAVDIGNALARDPDSFGGMAQVDELAGTIRERIRRSWLRAVRLALARRAEAAAARGAEPRESTARDRVNVEFLIHRQIDSAAVLEELRRHDFRRMSRAERRSHGRERGYTLFALHESTRYVREHSEHELTAGIVGTLQGDEPVSGLERVAVARGDGTRVFRRVDALGRSYWSGLRVQVPADGGEPVPEGGRSSDPVRLTLDLDLQRAARDLLDGAVAHCIEQKGGPPQWGAMILVEVATGDVLAMVGVHYDEDGEVVPYGAFPPTQCLYEPGSVVKPLHIALGSQAGVVDWNERINCSGAGLPGPRTIVDSHVCVDPTPHGIIVNSSNIGAVRLGMRLGAEGLDRYLRLYGFGETTGLGLPNEYAGSIPTIAGMHAREQTVYTAPSVCFGYAFMVTPVQVVRAYLNLLSGAPRQLRVRADAPVPAVGRRFLDHMHVQRVLAAMTDVVSDTLGATGRRIAVELRDLGVPEGWIAGKTGTSQFGELVREKDENGKTVVRRYETRSASFVGLAPSHAPRYVAMGVLQKRDASSFYGGRYTGPWVARLLLRALAEHGARAASPGQAGAAPQSLDPRGRRGQTPSGGRVRVGSASRTPGAEIVGGVQPAGSDSRGR